MTEDFDVKLVEDVKSYTPDPQYGKMHGWGITRKPMRSFLQILMDSGKRWQKSWTGSGHGTRVKEWNYPYAKMVYQRQAEHFGKLS
jgi:hypothetical protein